MTKLLDTSQAESIAEVIIEALDDAGYTVVVENIPGLVQAIVVIAENGPNTTQLLDEAADLLADGGVDNAD